MKHRKHYEIREGSPLWYFLAILTTVGGLGIVRLMGIIAHALA